jgi:hypothetical protein
MTICHPKSQHSRTKVSEHGVLIPKTWLEGIGEVEIRKEQSVIIVMPIIPDDPILNLGRHPIFLDVENASVNHDRSLYDR